LSLVSYETDGNVGLITLDRPEAHNAISGALADDLTEVLGRVAADNDVWVVVLRAAGERAFCVGADLKERAGFSVDDFYGNRKQIRGMFEALRSMPQPTIAAIFGFAVGGGCELALSCDLIVAARGTKLSLPEARVGLIPAGGGTQLLTRKLGTARAKELIFRGRQIDAEEARDLGLVADVCERAELDGYALEMARRLLEASPVALREAKRAIDSALGVPLDDAIDIENDAWTVVIASEDRSEGINAFVEKRSPVWKNR
jgi:enoyl-CoA hydratase/carnithine racemase